MMYIFVGINVDKTLENIGRKVNEINDNLGYEHSTLPLHISLKMSFEIGDGRVKNCIKILTNYFKNGNELFFANNSIDDIYKIF